MVVGKGIDTNDPLKRTKGSLMELHQSMAFNSMDEDSVFMHSFRLRRSQEPPTRNILTISTLQLHRYSQFSDGSWLKFTWMECERDFSFHQLCEPWNLWMTISHIFWDFKRKFSKFFPWFLMQLVGMQESYLNGILQFRTGVKSDSVKR